MNIALLVLALLLSLACAAFCAGMETGFLSVSRGRIEHLAREGGAMARLVHAALRNMAHTTATLLVGNNLAAVGYSAASAALADILFPDAAGARTAWSFGTAVGILYFGEFLPKLFCAARPLRRTLRFVRPWTVFERILRPLSLLALAVTGIFMPRTKPAESKRLSPEDVLRILQDRKDGVCLTDLESALIARILVLRAKNRPITPEAILSALD